MQEEKSKWRHIGGGHWDGEDVTLEINDETKEIQMIFWGEWGIEDYIGRPDRSR